MNPFVDGAFEAKFLTGDTYSSQHASAGIFSRMMPSLSFYSRLFLGPVRWLCVRASKGLCDDTAWVYASAWVADLIERMGCPIEIEGMNAIEAVDGPCLFVANHMSTLETFMLPAMIRPRRPVTFVVKKSLTTMPLFGPVMCSRDPIVVGPCRTSDTVHIIFTIMRNVKVDNQADIVNVNAACHDIRSY